MRPLGRLDGSTRAPLPSPRRETPCRDAAGGLRLRYDGADAMAWLHSTLVASAALLAAPAAWAAACDNPRQMDGFKTCADVDAAEKEGQFILYSTDPETN